MHHPQCSPAINTTMPRRPLAVLALSFALLLLFYWTLLMSARPPLNTNLYEDTDTLQRFLVKYAGDNELMGTVMLVDAEDEEVVSRSMTPVDIGFLAPIVASSLLSPSPPPSALDNNKTTLLTSTVVANIALCPSASIVTVEDGGRLGNKIWEYAAVWSLARILGRPGYVPDSILEFIGRVFVNLSLPALESISHCKLHLGEPVKRWLISLDTVNDRFRGKNLLLHKWIVSVETVLEFREQIQREFHFQPRILSQVQDTMRAFVRSRGEGDVTFVGVHVRRTDFASWLPKRFDVKLVGAKFFLKAMAWFRQRLKGESLLFLVVSDDPAWCERELVMKSKDVVLASKGGVSSPGHDLALLASCNHTIVDYGTFGAWGALMAGGQTISLGIDEKMDVVLETDPNWHVWRVNEIVN